MSKKQIIGSFCKSDLTHTEAALGKIGSLLKCVKCQELPEDPHILGNCDCSYCHDCIKLVSGHCVSCNVQSYPKDMAPDSFSANVVSSHKALKYAIDKAKTSRVVETTQEETILSASHLEAKAKKESETAKPKERKRSLSGNTIPVEQQIPNSSGAVSGVKLTTVTNPGLLKRNNKGETLLHLACITCRLEKVKDLLSQGANPNVKDNAGWTPLHEAVVRNNQQIVEALLDAGAYPSAAGGENLDTPLHEAVSSNLVNIVELLVVRGASPFARNEKGKTPMDCTTSEVLKAAMRKKGVQETYKTWRPPFFEPGLSVVMSVGAKDEQARVKKLCSTLGVKTSNTLSDKVTHIVTTATGGMIDTSLEVYIALMKGLWIVDVEWLRKSAETGEILDPALFEVQGVRGASEAEAPFRARRNAEYQLPGLFSGCSVYLHGNFVRIAKNELNNFVRYSDGNVLNRAPDPERISDAEKTVPYHAEKGSTLWECSHFVIFDPSSRMPDIKYKMAHIKTLPLNWFLDCIENFKLIEIDRPEYSI